jgi:transcriptional regulator with XRE-family HTH domain
MKSFAPRLRRARKAHRWTQAELAKRLRVHEMTVSRWERGVELPSLPVLDRIARVLGLSIEELIR